MWYFISKIIFMSEVNEHDNDGETDKSFLDTIKDFFCNFKWPSCCKCNEIKNEEISELKTPLNARNSSI